MDTVKIKMVARNCPNCGSQDQSRIFAPANFDLSKLDEYAFASRKMPEYMHYRLLSCPVCDLVYASPIPDQAMIAEAYHQAAFDSGSEAHFASYTYGRLLAKFKTKLPDLTGVLDIGTGDGAFLEQLLEANFSEVSGVEPSAAPIAAAKPAIRTLIRHAMFQAQDYQAASLSLVTCFQTLEHLYDPASMSKAAYKLLKPGGAVFFVCHNRRAFSAKVLGTKSPIFDIEHLQLFSPISARQLLERTGFSNIELRPVFNRYPLYYWLRLLPLPLKLKKKLIATSKKLKVGNIPIMLPAGNLAIVGYKPLH